MADPRDQEVQLRISEIRASLVPDEGRTHWDGCETDRRHKDCAMAFLLSHLDTLTAERDTLRSRVQQWEDSALLKDRSRRAIRERHRAGETVDALAEDYGVPVKFVEGLVSWQMFGDDPNTPNATAPAPADGPEAK